MRCLRLIVVLASGCLLAGAPAASAASMTPKTAAGFRDSVGVNTHVSYFDTAYGNWPAIVQRLDELGIDHLRDGAFGNPASSWTGWNARYFGDIDLAVAHGKRFDFVMGAPNYGGGSLNDLATAVDGRLHTAAEALEGPNEFDIQGGTPNWTTPLSDYVTALHARVAGDPALRDLPLFGPTFAFNTSFSRMGTLAGLFGYGNIHPYAGGEAPSLSHLGSQMALSALVAGSAPTVATEAGFHNALNATTGQPGVPEDVAAVYTLRTLFDDYDAGIFRTYLYELVDEKPNAAGTDPEQHFGLLRNDLSLKPAAVALENLLRVIGRPAAGGSEAVDVGFDGDLTGVRRLLLADGSGHYHLVLWQSGSLWDTTHRARLTLPTRTLTVTLPAASVTAYRPVQSATGSALPVAGGQVQVSLGEDPVILDFTAGGNGAPATACGCAPTPAPLPRPTTTPKPVPAGSPAPVLVGLPAPVARPAPAAPATMAPIAAPVRTPPAVKVAAVLPAASRRADRVVLSVCPVTARSRVRAVLGVRGRTGSALVVLAHASVVRRPGSRLEVAVSRSVRAAATRRGRRLVLRLTWTPPGSSARARADVLVPRSRPRSAAAADAGCAAA